MIRYTISLMCCWVLVTATGLAGDAIISDIELDIKVLKKSVESLDDAEKLTKKLDHLQDRYNKAPSSEKKAKVLEKLTELKIDLVKNESFPDAWRGTLAKALKIKDEHITDTYPSVEEIGEMVAKERSLLLEKYFPLSLRAKLEKEAVARFPTSGEGDMISITINGRTISGRVNRLSETSAMIGSTTVPISDLPPSFHVRRMVKNRQDYVRENYTEKRQAYLKSMNKKLPPHIYRKNGYINYEDEWVPVIKVVERIDERIQELHELGVAEEDKKRALMGNIKKYSILAAAGLGVLIVLGLIVAVKARKKE